MKQDTRTIMQFAKVITLMILLVVTGCVSGHGDKKARKPVSPRHSGDWVKEFNVEKRPLATVGENRYFVLKPGFQLVLEEENEKVVVTVLDETKQIGQITTRVVEEREEKNGELAEISKNYFAICKDTADVFYFGEDVDIYKDGKIVGHSGAWRADEKSSKPGMMMPGVPSIGARYYQEIAPGKAMDRAEVVSISETLKTPAGTFTNCLKAEETSALNPNEKSYKTYAPGIGLIQDEGLLLTHYGFLKLSR
jgi:hypothetical protein